MSAYRWLLPLRGAPDETAAAALEELAGCAPEDVLWVSGRSAPLPFAAVEPRRARRLLGRSYLAVVLDLHDGPDADLIGLSGGFVWGGGALMLRLPVDHELPMAGRARLAVWPFGESDVGDRLWARLLTGIDGRSSRWTPAVARAFRDRLSTPLAGDPATDAQARAVTALTAAWLSGSPRSTVLVADRGRGKSAALGLALRRWGEAGGEWSRVAVVADDAAAWPEIRRFAGVGPEGDGPRVMSALAAAGQAMVERDPPPLSLLIIDEAARLPVPVLQRIVERHPSVHLALSTTARGYEGTGRGFELRFVPWLAGRRPVARLTMDAPIRFVAGDPLERWLFDRLLLDAEPATLPTNIALEAIEATELDRGALAADERLLRDLFGLLVHAHYRTTPGDLHRLLDAPNLRIHALLLGDRVVAATWIALEGGLTAAMCDDLYWGRQRLRGHALTETLVSHCGAPPAGRLELARSVRIAVHPALRRRGLGRRLVEHVHRAHPVDLFGTVFGATPGLIAFREAVGYRLVRLGASRGSRTGEPAAVMMRPVSPAAEALVQRLGQALARGLPLQLELMDGDGLLLLDPALRGALLSAAERASAGAPASDAPADATVAHFAFGPRTFESAAGPIIALCEAHRSDLAALSSVERGLIEGRVLARKGWDAVMAEVGLPSVAATMRGVRRAVRALVRRVRPDIEAQWGPERAAGSVQSVSR